MKAAKKLLQNQTQKKLYKIRLVKSKHCANISIKAVTERKMSSLSMPGGGLGDRDTAVGASGC